MGFGDFMSQPKNIGAVAAGGVGAGALMKAFGSGSPDFNNPATQAQPYFDRIPETLKPFFQKYINQGDQADPTLQNQYGSMTSNPGAFLNNIGQGYQESPGYQFKLHQALTAGNNAAAAGGMLGSPMHQEQNENVAEGLANNDYENWFNHALGIFSGGQKGLEGLSDRGFKASTGYGEDLASALMSQGSLAGAGAAEENNYNQAKSNADSGLWGNVAGIAAHFIPGFGG